MSYDSNSERVVVGRANSVTNNIEIKVGENKRIWLTPEEARHAIRGLQQTLKELGL